MTSPSGAFGPALERITAKAQAWVDTAKNAKLSRQNLWFLVDRQFWPKVGFGIGTIVAPFDDLTACLHRQYYQLLSLGGIRRSVPTPVRYLGRGFFGSGCPHLGVEATISGLEKLLIHYGCDTVVGRKLQVSVEFLVMELGISAQPGLLRTTLPGHGLLAKDYVGEDMAIPVDDFTRECGLSSAPGRQ